MIYFTEFNNFLMFIIKDYILFSFPIICLILLINIAIKLKSLNIKSVF